MNIPHVPPDKALHYIWGSLAYLAALGLLLAVQAPDARHLALAFVVLLGTAKEAADALANRSAARRGESLPHKVEFADAFATVLGGLVCWVAGAA